MTKEELLERINDLEWEDFEVKEAKSQLPKSIWETVSSFSNTAGGWIVLGVKQTNHKFEISGTKNIEQLEQDFNNTLAAKQKFNVLIRPVIKKYHFPEGDVLAFYIPLSDKKPVYYNHPDNTFVRYGSADVRASKEEIDAMYRDQAFGTKTAEVAPGSSLDDLNLNSVENYRDYMGRFNKSLSYNKLSTVDFLNKTAVTVGQQLTYSGLLFFGKQDSILEHFPDFRIDLLEIPGTSYSDSRVRYTYRLPEQENIWEYYFALFERISQKVDKPFTLTKEGFAAEDFPHIEALREATVNMLMHADYFSPAKSRVRIFTNHIEFFNPGGLPKPLKMLMETDISIPRNKTIAKLFRLVKLAENAGFGFDRMNAGWSSFSKTLPEYNAERDFLIVKFFLEPETVEKSSDKTVEGSDESSDKGSEKTVEKTVEKNWEETRQKLDEKLDKKLGETQWKILELIFEDKYISITSMSEKIGIVTSAIEKNINKLKTNKLVSRIGKPKTGYWKINLPE